MMGKKIGIFGGSFDPIHYGHLNLAKELLGKLSLDEVWFCPTAGNPFKSEGSKVTAEDRVAMAKLAIENNPHFKILDIEAKQKGPCFTVDTLRALKAMDLEKGEFNTYFLLMGDDLATSFHLWKEPQEIIKLAHLVVGTRDGLNQNICFQGPDDVSLALKDGIVSTPVMELSSTEVRRRLKKNLSCSDLVPLKVLDYISLHHLY